MPILFGMMAVNYWGDAANLFNDGYVKKMVSIIAGGNYVTNITNYDGRLFQKEFANSRRAAYDVLILGSSRTMLINSDYFRGQKVFNCSVSGASIEDLVAIYQMYKEKKILPKKILFGIDPWIFNKNSGQSRWLSVAEQYKSFFNGKKPIEVNPGLKDFRRLQLISPSYFQISLKRIPGVFTGEFTPKSTANKFNKTNTQLTDGSLIYAEAFRNLSQAETDAEAQNYLKGDIYSIEHYDTLSKETQEIFDMLMNDCKKNNISVAFILQPYHPAVYQVIKKKTPAVLLASDYIRSYATQNHLKVFGSYDPAGLGLNKTYFYDGMHDKPEAIAEILGKDKWLTGN